MYRDFETTGSDMSIENMATISYVMFGVSGVCAVAAAVLFFMLDIPRCWRMVSGRHALPGKKQRRTDRGGHAWMPDRAEKTAGTKEQTTEKLPTEKQPERWSAAETVLLDGIKTAPLGTASLQVVQDIMYMQDTAE